MHILKGIAEVKNFENSTPHVHITFSTPFKNPPEILVSMCGMDAKVAGVNSLRLLVNAANITNEGFDVTFCTWADSYFYEATANWIAFGQ